MNDELNAVCIVCGKPYHCCLSCREQKSFSPWRTVTDTMEHYKIHTVLSGYNNGYLTEEEAGKQLEAIPYDLEELKESVQMTIKKIRKPSHDSKPFARKKK